MVRVVCVKKLQSPEQRAAVCYVGRPFAGWPGSPWGNYTKRPCPGPYRQYLMSLQGDELARLLESLWAACDAGAKPLGCWCLDWDGTGKTPACHAAVWAELLNGWAGKMLAKKAPTGGGDMGSKLTIVQLKVGTLRGSLQLKRTPRFLRFVMTGTDWATLDALDQLDDVAYDGERLLAGTWDGPPWFAMVDGTDKKGKRVGWQERGQLYKLVEPQPSQELMTDTAQWRAWCLAELAKITAAKEPTT